MSVFSIGYYDNFDLLCSLKPRLPLFKGEGGIRTLGLRGPKKDAENPDDVDLYVNATFRSGSVGWNHGEKR